MIVIHVNLEFSILNGKMTELKDRTDLPYRFFKPKNSNRWNIGYSIKGHSQIKRALRTADNDEALAKAAEIYQRDVILAEHNALVTKNGFRSVARAYVKWRKDRAGDSRDKIREAQHTERAIERYLIPAFKNKAIDKITFSDIAKYQDWRRPYWTTGPGATQAYSSNERNGKTIRQKIQI